MRGKISILIIIFNSLEYLSIVCFISDRCCCKWNNILYFIIKIKNLK